MDKILINMYVHVFSTSSYTRPSQKIYRWDTQYNCFVSIVHIWNKEYISYVFIKFVDLLKCPRQWHKTNGIVIGSIYIGSKFKDGI